MDEIFNLCFRSICYPDGTGFIYKRPNLDDPRLKEAYEKCRVNNDSEASWEDFDKRYILECYTLDGIFLGFEVMGYKPSLDAMLLTIYLHPSVSYRYIAPMGNSIGLILYQVWLDLGRDSYRFYTDSASKYLINSLYDLYKDLTVVPIYKRYTVIYYEISREGMIDVLRSSGVKISQAI